MFMNRVAELRKEYGMKQLALAEALGVQQQTVSRYETGDRDLDTATIARLCEIFSVTADYLLGLSTQRTAQISDEDAALLEAYHACSGETRRIIDAALQPYLEEKTLSALPDAK